MWIGALFAPWLRAPASLTSLGVQVCNICSSTGAAWPADPRARFRMLCGVCVGASDDEVRLSALSMDAAWSVVVPGVIRRRAPGGGVVARLRGKLRPDAAARALEAFL